MFFWQTCTDVENTFRQIDAQPESATNIVKAITILHNFILAEEPERSTVVNRNEHDVIEPNTTIDGLNPTGTRATRTAMRVRETFMDYFTSARGAVPWQNEQCFES